MGSRCADSRQPADDSLIIHSAKWVIPVSAGVIENGSVVCDRDTIIAVGSTEEICGRYAGARRLHYAGALLPALVNGHIHLELSHLTDVPRPSPHQSMCSWIESLLQQRNHGKFDDAAIGAAAQHALMEQYRSGVILLADIGNSKDIVQAPENTPLQLISFLECLAPNRRAKQELLDKVAAADDAQLLTAHAPYSTIPQAITCLKKRAQRLGHIFPIHTAESAAEGEFVRAGSGPFRDFLEKRGSWDGSFQSLAPERLGTIDYFNKLNILDSRTLCVHCVHITREEIALLSEKDVKVCLCPGSNRFLRVGKAPLEPMLAAGLLPALGTDSRSSNESLDMWREMQLVREDYPAVDPSTILKMATLGGARALGRAPHLGSLAAGSSGLFLHVCGNGVAAVKDGSSLLDFLVQAGRPETVEWICCDTSITRIQRGQGK